MKKTLKSVFALTLALLLTLSLCACGSKEPVQGALELPATPVADPVVALTMSETERAEMMAAYQLALQDFAFNHILPDGTTFEMGEGFGYMEENAFAIYDVDSDGVEELLIQFNTAPMAGLFEGVYHYVDGAVTEQMIAFPGCNYYFNNTVLCPWSHNQTNGPDFWPYSVCVYRAATDTYEYAAHVEGWDKSVSKTDYDGNTFPADKDDGSGVVYLVTTVGNETPEVFSRTAFAMWEQLTFGGVISHLTPDQEKTPGNADTAPVHDIPWRDMTEQNINGLVTE